MSNEDKWTSRAGKMLIGKRIVGVFYMPEEVTKEIGWDKRPLMLKLDDGSFLYPQMDDEGNDGGAFYYQKGDEGETLPVF